MGCPLSRRPRSACASFSRGAAANVLTGITKYFLGNRVPGRRGRGVRALLRVAFARPIVEICFREAKEELGWDHFECRGWQCVHRHLYISFLSQLFCARVRHRLCRSEVVTDAKRLTVEQVRRAMDEYIDSLSLPPRLRRQRYQAVADQIHRTWTAVKPNPMPQEWRCPVGHPGFSGSAVKTVARKAQGESTWWQNQIR